MNRMVKAFLLNALVLPGLGQLFLGRKIRGIAFVMAINMVLLLALFVVLKALSPVIAVQIAGGSPLSVAQVSEAINSAKGFGKGILLAFGVVWGAALFDVVKGRDADNPEE